MVTSTRPNGLQTEQKPENLGTVGSVDGTKLGKAMERSSVPPDSDCIRVAAPSDLLHTANARESSDDSSLSSVETETFDTVPDSSNTFLSKVDVNGILRYGSLDVAEDTGLSSVSSSSLAERKPLSTKVRPAPGCSTSLDDNGPRKRVALSVESVQQSDKDAGQPASSHPSNSPRSHPFIPEAKRSPPAQVKTEETDTVALTALSPKIRRNSKITKLKTDIRPRSSIPKDMSWEEYGRQCILAAHSSRLNPYALHVGEYRLLRNHITQPQVTIYLNIRNGILRLWTRNPMVSVTKEEAAGCAKEARFFELAYFAYEWLVRNGYINFGCVEVPIPSTSAPRGRKPSKQKTIVVVGAGMSGLGCARQLEGLFQQLGDRWVGTGELPPKVVVLEGRSRIGGRVYSHPLRSQVANNLPGELRNTAEMGAQIITGFRRGNPLNILVRGQLGLRYHFMLDEVYMQDCDGRLIDEKRDLMVNSLHRDLLERTSEFRVKPNPVETLEGIPEYIKFCQDPIHEEMAGHQKEKNNSTVTDQGRQQVVPPGFAKLQGRTQVVAGNSSSVTAAQALRDADWQLRPGISRNHTLNLDTAANASSHPTLGATMDEAVRQYQRLVELTPQDMRLLSWHYADLEYANAAMVNNLSLGGHDQDSGNEFSGKHSEVVGGYIQVPRGLWSLPHKLDVRFGCAVRNIKYTSEDHAQIGPAVIECTNGERIEADRVILTSPLGVLKANAIGFDPPLPDWKVGAINRMGFGLLNKVVLLYERAFWPPKYDILSLLNESDPPNSMDPRDYAARRGRFYLLWNCVANSGRPMLIALMAGNAAHEVEKTDTNELVREVTEKFARKFAPQHVPAPVEVIVTRWKSDPFSRGTYSYVGPKTDPRDYDVMAAPVGNLHFAGEATCGTHPATVHGAYLSGLRVAAEVLESLTGPIDVPQPLIPPKQTIDLDPPGSRFDEDDSPMRTPLANVSTKTKTTIKLRFTKELNSQNPIEIDPSPKVNPYRTSANSRSSLDEDYEALIIGTILSRIGDRPMKPGRPGVNPFLLFTNQNWDKVKTQLQEERRAATGDADAKAGRNEIRVAIGRMWREASEDVKKPFLEQCETAQQSANEARAAYERDVVKWDEDARRIREEFLRENPPPENGNGQTWSGRTAIEVGSAGGRKRAAVNYAESDGE